MLEIVLGVILFTSIVLVLALVIMLARFRLVPSGNLTINVNAERDLSVPAGDKLLAIELDQHRDGDIETRKEWHFFVPRLVSFQLTKGGGTLGGRKLLWEGKEKRLDDRQYNRWLLATFDRLAARAAKYSGFVPATIIRRVDCDFLNVCGDYKMVEKGISWRGKPAFAVQTPALHALDNGPTTDFSSKGIDEMEYLRIGKRRVLRITIGHGWDMNPCDHAANACTDSRSTRASPVPKTLREGVRHKRGLHHGVEWDVLLLK